MSGDPQQLAGVAVAVASVLVIGSGLYLHLRRRVPERSLSRITLFCVGLALIQVANIAGDAETTKDFIRVAMLAGVLIVLAVVAFLDGWRAGAAPAQERRA